MTNDLERLGSRLGDLKAKRDALYSLDYSKRAGELLNFYSRVMTKVIDSERCSVFINDRRRDKVWLKAGTGVAEHDIEVPKGESIVGKVIASGEPMIVSDLESKPGTHKEVDKKTGFVTRNILCVPIKSPTRDEVTGAFEILNKLNGKKFNDEDISLAKEIASHLQVEVDTVYLDQEIFDVSERLHTAAWQSTKLMFTFIGVVVAILLIALAGRMA